MCTHTNLYILLDIGSNNLLRRAFIIANLSDIFPLKITDKCRGPVVETKLFHVHGMFLNFKKDIMLNSTEHERGANLAPSEAEKLKNAFHQFLLVGL